MYRILHIIDTLNYGGAERQLLLNVSALDRSLFQSYICCVEEEGALAATAAELGVPVYSLGIRGKPQWPQAVFRLGRLLRSLKIDLIHTSLADADILGAAASRFWGIPAVSTLCSIAGGPERMIDNPQITGFKLAVNNKLWGLALRSGHRRCIAISQAVKQSSIKVYGLREEKLSVIYRSLPDSWFTAALGTGPDHLRATLGLENAYPILLNVGRLVPAKGQRYLLQAMPQVLARFPQARLLIAGEGPLRGALETLVQELGIAPQVNLLGRRSDVRDLLALSDIFVFPSVFEGLGASLVEAAGMGKPCIASRVGPIPEVVEEGKSGMLVPSRSPQALAQAIIELAGDRERAAAMGRRGREIAQDKFRIAPAIQQLEALYRQLLPTAGRTGDLREGRGDVGVEVRG
ncbi:MAG TPA: glycosyltransferase [Dehalococcoidia bacterium]|nr:glycosyltransferase [Dehalococcoidia bacterium]